MLCLLCLTVGIGVCPFALIRYIFVLGFKQASSGYDPSFWAIHPALERAWHAKFMTGGFNNYEWPTVATENDWVCDNFECFNDQGQFGRWRECCQGHYIDDSMMDFIRGNHFIYGNPNPNPVLSYMVALLTVYHIWTMLALFYPLPDHLEGTRSGGYGPTNKQTLLNGDASSPNYRMDYIYDNFEYPHW
jgi:hypothetical protein